MHVTLRSASIYPQTGRYKTIMISNAKEHTRETVSQPIIREKLQWDAQDAKSSLGNATFSRGDYKRSFLIHSACMQLSGTRCIIETIRRSSSDATLALEHDGEGVFSARAGAGVDGDTWRRRRRFS